MLVVNNSTFSGKSAPDGGGIHTEFTTGGPTHFSKTIVANNSGGDCNQSDLNIDESWNLSSDGTCSFSGNNESFPFADPMLGPLADNGGPTQTMALLPGSPAIDAAVCPPPETDQRGVTRPQGPLCDIGAYEVQNVTEPPTEPANK